jgi:hypothetical protein
MSFKAWFRPAGEDHSGEYNLDLECIDPQGCYMGDGILVYFGYPQAHEDDAVRNLLPSTLMLITRSGSLIAEIGDAVGSVERGNQANSPSSAFASFRSTVSKPSVNHP